MKFSFANNSPALLLALLAAAARHGAAYVPNHASAVPRRAFRSSSSSASAPMPSTTVALRSAPPATESDTESAFSAFADSLDEDSLFDEGAEDDAEEPTWQESLDSLLDPTTPLAKRQILLSDLLNANEDIRTSVQTALSERKIDALLTPTGKKLQDGTRAVARQITTDILPGIAAAVSSGPPTPNNDKSPAAAIAEELPTLVPKLGSRIFDALSNQAKSNLELLQGDLADPSRIPERISKQAAEVATEAKNVFLETPEGLSGPEYKVVSRGEGYEIREYEAYSVASTDMAKVGEPYSVDDLASGGAAFNALAAYLFGANDAGRAMEMTTPVTTTSLGEMRFYLKKEGFSTDPFPSPVSDEDDRFNEKGAVSIVEVPPARLAVRRFTGFVTEGEVERQKDALLSSLAVDGIEVDVPHGAVVPHVVFQYNPPYTIPIVRRNEVAVPVRELGADGAADLETEWVGEHEDDDDDELSSELSSELSPGGSDSDDIAPSDIE